MQLLVHSLSGRVLCLELPQHSTVGDLKAALFAREGLPIEEQRLTCGASELGDLTLALTDNAVIRVKLRILGGKGGFGSLLRGGPAGVRVKKTTNFDSCRDLATGLRLRAINNEKKMEAWEQKQLEKDMAPPAEADPEEEEKKRAREFDKDKFMSEVRETNDVISNAVGEGLKMAVQKERELLERKRQVEKASTAINPPSKKHKLWSDIDDLLAAAEDEDSDDKDDEGSDEESEEKAEEKKKTETLKKAVVQKKKSDSHITPVSPVVTVQ